MTDRIPFPSRSKGQRGRITSEVLCEACWRVIKRPEKAYTVVADEGIGWLLELPAAEPNGGAFPIGPECAKDIPASHKLHGWMTDPWDA